MQRVDEQTKEADMPLQEDIHCKNCVQMNRILDEFQQQRITHTQNDDFGRVPQQAGITDFLLGLCLSRRRSV